MVTDLDWLQRIDPLEGIDTGEAIEVPDPAWVLSQLDVDRSSTWRRRRWAVVAATGAAGVVALCLVLANLTLDPRVAAAVVVQQEDSSVTVTINQQAATAQDLAQAFAQHQLPISIRLVPVSPSEVGRVITVVGPGTASVRPVPTPGCPIGTPSCPITLRISHITRRSALVVGRVARPGERYASGASAFADGEALHCSGLLNATVAQARGYLQAHSLVGTFRQAPSTGGIATSTTSTTGTTSSDRKSGVFVRADPATVTNTEYVAGGESISSTSVILWASNTKLSPAEANADGGAGC